jgi:hypothetical protein
VSEIYLTDREIPDLTKWRMAALMEGLQRELTWQETPGRAERLARIELLRNEIKRRGIDTEPLIRQGFGFHIALSIYLARAVARRIGDTDANYAALGASKEWADIITVTNIAEGDRQTLGPMDMTEIVRLIAWVLSAPLDNVLNWTPPRYRSDISLHPGFSEGTEPVWSWLADRFTETYLPAWRPPSLREEWKYLHGGCVAPLGSADMAIPKIDEAELARILADQLVDGTSPELTIASGSPSYVRLALQLFKDGHRATAAAMFEAATTITPDDGELFNNWAFCIIPDDPDGALKLLDQAALLGMEHSLLVVANRLYCYLRTGRFTTALTYAEDVCSRWSILAGDTGYMWPIDGSDLVYVKLHEYVLDVVQAIASATGDPVIVTSWSKKVQKLREALQDS